MNRKEVLLLSIGVFLTVVCWLIADIYHASTEDKIKTKITTIIVNKEIVKKTHLE